MQPPPPETRGAPRVLAARCAASISSSEDLDFWVEKLPRVIRWKPQLWLAGVAPLTSCEQHYKAHTVASTLVLPRWQLLGKFWQRLLQQINKNPTMSRRRHSQGSRTHTHTHTHTSYPRISSVNRHPSVCQQDTHSLTHAEGYRSQNHSPLINQYHPPDPVARSSLIISHIFTRLWISSRSVKMRFSPLLSWRRTVAGVLLMETGWFFQSCWPFLTHQSAMDPQLETGQLFSTRSSFLLKL